MEVKEEVRSLLMDMERLILLADGTIVPKSSLVRQTPQSPFIMLFQRSPSL